MIRPATYEDLPELSRLFDLYRQFYQQPSSLAAAEAFLKERMDKQESVIFVADLHHKPASLVGFTQLYPSFSSVRLRTCWILNDLYVDVEHRRQDFAEALMRKAMEFSQTSGARGLSLQTAHSNLAAQGLYEKLGWQRDGQFYTYHFFH